MSITSTAAKLITMSVYTVLEGEHHEVDLLFKAIEASPDMATGRTGLFAKLNLELRSHARAEQAAVYDLVKTKEDVEELIEDAESEHQDMEKLLNELESMDITSDAWMLKLSELKKVVEHHVHEEESEMFEKMHELFSDDEAKAMADDFRQRKIEEVKKIKQR